MPNKDNLRQATEDEMNISCVIKEYSAYDPMSNEEQFLTEIPTFRKPKHISFWPQKDSLALILCPQRTFGRQIVITLSVQGSVHPVSCLVHIPYIL